MPYFPQTYPHMEWWIGKVFVQQAVSLANQFLHDYDDRTAGYVMAEYRLLLARALRALHGVKAAGTDHSELKKWVPEDLVNRLAFQREVKVESRSDFFTGAFTLLVLVKEEFWRRYSEVTKNEWNQVFEPYLEQEEEDGNFPDPDQVEEEIVAVMRRKHDEVYWVHSEAGVLAGFGGYGEWREFQKIAAVEMQVRL